MSGSLSRSFSVSVNRPYIGADETDGVWMRLVYITNEWFVCRTIVQSCASQDERT